MSDRLQSVLAGRMAAADCAYKRFRHGSRYGYALEGAAGRMLDPVAFRKNSRSTTAGPTAEGFFVKRYNVRGFWHSLRRRFQFPRAFRCLSAALCLEELGIETPRVQLAAVDHRYGFLCGNQYLLTDMLPDDAVYLDLLFPTLSQTARTGLLHELAAFVARLHTANIEHGDLSLRNIYRLPNGAFGLIDLDSCILHTGNRTTWRRHELARVISSAVRVLNEEDAASFLSIWTREAQTTYQKAGGVLFTREALLRRAEHLLAHPRR